MYLKISECDIVPFLAMSICIYCLQEQQLPPAIINEIVSTGTATMCNTHEHRHKTHRTEGLNNVDEKRQTRVRECSVHNCKFVGTPFCSKHTCRTQNCNNHGSPRKDAGGFVLCDECYDKTMKQHIQAREHNATVSY